MAQKSRPQVESLSGLPQPLVSQNPPTIIAKRDPTVLDTGYPLGTIWDNKVGVAVFVLSKVAAGQATWIMIGASSSGINTLSAEGGAPSLPVANNFDFSGDVAGAFLFSNAGAGLMGGSVQVDGVTIQIIGNQLVAVATGSIPFTSIILPTLATANSGWYAGAPLTLTLPVSAGLVDGDQVIIICKNAGPIIVQANAAQVIQVSSVTSALAGTATNTATGDALTLRFEVASTSWTAESSVGNWTVV